MTRWPVKVKLNFHAEPVGFLQRMYVSRFSGKLYGNRHAKMNVREENKSFTAKFHGMSLATSLTRRQQRRLSDRHACGSEYTLLRFRSTLYSKEISRCLS